MKLLTAANRKALLGDDELGYFSLHELATVKVRFGLSIERDLYWKPEPLSKVVKRG